MTTSGGWGPEGPRVAEAVACAWRAAEPDAGVRALALGDGRPGTAEAVRASGRAEDVLVLAADVVDGGPRARDDAVDALRSGTSRELGRLLAGALATDARTIVVALGGEPGRDIAWADAGAGLLEGLAEGLGVAVPSPGRLAAGGLALAGTRPEDLPDLGALRAHLAGRDVRVLHHRPDALLGLGGLAGTLATGLLDAAEAQDLERALGDLVQAVAGARGGTLVGRDLLGASLSATSAPGRSVAEHARELGAARGGAAGGGAGLALAALGARAVAGAPGVAELVGLEAELADADLVVVVAPVLDGDESHDGVVPVVAGIALDRLVPTVVLAGASFAGRREWSALGVAAVHETGWRTAADVVGADGRATVDAVERTARVARTWRL